MSGTIARDRFFGEQTILSLDRDKRFVIIAAMHTLENTADVIDALGGNAAVASLLNVTERIVRHWRYSKEFPPKTYLAIKSALDSRQIKASESLWGFMPVNDTLRNSPTLEPAQ